MTTFPIDTSTNQNTFTICF